MASVSASSLNPISNINIGSLSTFGAIAVVIAIVVMVLVLIGVLVYINVNKKNYWIIIKVWRLIGNTPTLVADYRAKEVPMGMAGDKLWRVAPSNALLMAFKVIKWLPVGKLQSAPKEFWYWVREDGEWINFQMKDLDQTSKTMNIKFVQEDMRLQRLATDRLLEQRLMNKSFWDQWKDTIMLIIFFLVTAICMVLIFYQFGKIVDKLAPLVDQITKSLDIIRVSCKLNQTSGVLLPVN